MHLLSLYYDLISTVNIFKNVVWNKYNSMVGVEHWADGFTILSVI